MENLTEIIFLFKTVFSGIVEIINAYKGKKRK